MLEILCKVLFFLSMLVVYANVTSTSIVLVIVLVYVVCVFSYYYFDNIQGAIDEWFNYLNVNARFNDTVSPSHLSGYFLNRKFSKMNSGNTALSSVSSKKIFGTLCSSDGTFAKENILPESRGPSLMKTNGDLPSPIMKNGSPSRSNRHSRDTLKLGFNAKSDAASRKNIQSSQYGQLGPNRRYNTNLDLETFMNVNSPGFTSRVVDKATESASYHIKYPAVRQIPAYRFDKSTLRQLSKIPKGNSTPAVRIAPPELNNIELLNTEGRICEPGSENLRSNDYLQVLKEISRKRNYCQEEADRSVTTPKKSRKNDVKNAVSSQYKRAHEDCSNDSIDDKSCKKRCDDVDRNYAKIMSFTSSMSVLVPEFSWSNNTKKRKSSRLDKSKNESPEKMEKCRKIDEEVDEQILVDEREKHTPKLKEDPNVSNRCKETDIQLEKPSEEVVQSSDEANSFFSDCVSTINENEEYVRVAGGKILNRTNCTYRKKLNNTKIDPVSVISTEPEYVSEMGYVDDKTMKENLLNNLVSDIERKGDKNDSVIFYQNSIVEEIEKKTTTVEVHKTDSSILTSSSINPLLPPTAKPTIRIDQTDGLSTASGLEVTKSTHSMEKPSRSEEIFANIAPIDASKKPEKIEIVAQVHRSNSPTPAPSSLNSLVPPSTLPVASPLQFNIPILTPTTQFSISSPETSKPNPYQSITSTSSSVLGDFGKTELATTVSNSASALNNFVSENSSSVASTNSSAPYNPLLQLPPKSVASSDQSRSPASAATSCSSSMSIAPIVFGSASQAAIPSTTNCNSLFTFNKPVNISSTTVAEPSKSLPPTFTPSSVSFGNSSVSLSLNNANSATLSFPATTTTQKSSSFSATGLTFGTINPATQNPASTFSFGSQSTPTFGQNNNSSNGVSHTSVFNAGTAENVSSQPSVFDGSSSSAANAQSNMFGAVNQEAQANPTPPLMFGANLQPVAAAPSLPVAQPSIFGGNTQPAGVSTSTVFGSSSVTPSTAAVQPSIFGSVASSQTQQMGTPAAPSSQTQSVFGSAGDTSSNVFGQNQSTAPPVGVVNPLPQSVPQFGNGNSNTSQFGANSSSMRFTFGNASSQQPAAFGTPQSSVSATATPAAVPSPFGTTSPAQPPNFGASNSGTPAFNFNAPPAFGTSSNTFGVAANSASTSANSMFNFGSSNAQPAPPAFQFGVTSAAAPSNPPFVFGGSPAPVVASAGGFSIGTGGGTTRNRPMARPRKAK